MDLILRRNLYRPDGIFGDIVDEAGKLVCVSLEHGYPDGKGGFVPKVAADVYNCVRHPPVRLPYETFLLEAVPDFQGKKVTGILFHCGNFNKDSEGCILVGERLATDKGKQIIENSKVAFAKFMNLQKGLQSFNLVVVDFDP